MQGINRAVPVAGIHVHVLPDTLQIQKLIVLQMESHKSECPMGGK